jgi:hypothetical protein
MKQIVFKYVLGLATCAVLGIHTGFAGEKFTRIQGSLKGSVAFSPTNITEGLYSVEVKTDGNLSHLGRSQAIWKGQILLDTNLNVTPMPPASWTITTAHGSSTGTLTWQARTTSKPGLYTVLGTFQVNGGTDGLMGATGAGVLQGTVDALKLKAKISLDAFAHLPRGKKK